MSGVVSLECASWYENEDGYVLITNKYGNTVFLNKVYSIIWEAIDGEKEVSILESELNGIVDKEQIEKFIKEICEQNIASVREEMDSFDMLF